MRDVLNHKLQVRLETLLPTATDTHTERRDPVKKAEVRILKGYYCRGKGWRRKPVRTDAPFFSLLFFIPRMPLLNFSQPFVSTTASV